MLRSGVRGLFRATRREYSTRTYKIGEKISGFTVGDVNQIPMLQMTAVELRHHDTGARHLHLDRDDDNNVFSIGFKTNPPDLTGVPHILEHTTLCGSHQFPVKDPFFSMLTRSLSNFMNAMTGLDYTYYPFATTNQTDFKNLQQVYLDAVYNPLLRESDFRQEGWRLEREEEGEDSKVIFKGVVYNEMKGMTSDPAYLFTETWLRSIYPSLQSSGGDPKHITELEYEDLKKFHDTRYHPSNAFSVSYGKMKLEEILKPMYDMIKPVKRLDLKEGVLQPLKMDEHVLVESTGPVDPLCDPDKQVKASLSWVVADAGNVADNVVWEVLGLLLTYGHSSVFYKALIDTGLGSDFAANTGVQRLPGKTIYSIGLQGMKEEDVPKFKEAVTATLKSVVEEGIPKNHLEAVINQVELSQREISSNYGLEAVNKLMPRVFNGDKPHETIDDEKMLKIFRDRIAERPKLFQETVQQRLVDAPAFEFVMRPDAEFEAKLAAEEEERLQATIARKKEVTAIEPSEKGDDNLLPMLTVDEIARDKAPVHVEKLENLYVRETGTQGLTYLTFLKNLANVPAHLRPLLPLFASSLTNLGTTKTPIDELENQIRLHTGGISSSLHVASDPTNLSRFSLNLQLSASSLDSKSFHIYDFLNQFLRDTDFKNVSKLRQFLQASAANAVGDIVPSGHAYATRHAASVVSNKRRLDELLNGVEQVQYIRKLADLSDDELLKEVVPQLEQIAAVVATQEGITGGVTFTPGNDNLRQNQTMFNDLVHGLPTHEPITPISDISKQTQNKTHFELPLGVSYAGVAVKGVPYIHEDAAALRVLCSHLTYRHLHQEIREKGGAYGGGASYSALDGVVSFYSYRDPNPVNTLKTVAGCADWVLGHDITDQELLSAKLSVFQGIDSPIPPRSEINHELLFGLTNEMRNKLRHELLSVKACEVKRVAEKYLTPALADNLSGAGATVIGPKSDSFNGFQVVKLEG